MGEIPQPISMEHKQLSNKNAYRLKTAIQR